MYSEDDYLPLSGIQHYRFCKRQCAFIHTEQQWSENFFTAHGRTLHEKVHSETGESRGDKRIERGLQISSALLGLSGQTDAVEIYTDGIVCPIEYKRGTIKTDITDEVQLCAQAICLEEMLRVSIDSGYLFYEKIKRREKVIFTPELRARTLQLSDEYHALIASGEIPAADYTKKCESCSFIDNCFPESAGRRKSVEGYIKRRLALEIEPDTEDS
jgi:CRISPR-associated exonuclease Cas4